MPTKEKNLDDSLCRPETRGPGIEIEERWLPLAGGRMRYLKAGSGRALILVHGLLGYSFSWRFTIPALAQCSTVYAVDNLGAGLSPSAPGMDCTMVSGAERLLQFAAALGITEFDLLGTSHGGALAMLAAALCAERHHPRVRRLILVAPVNPWSSHGRLLAPLVGSAVGKMIFRHTIAKWRFLDYLWLRRMFGDGRKIPADSLDGYRVPVRENHAYEHALQIVTSWSADLNQLEAAIPKIGHHPTLLMWGTRDRIVHYSSAERLRRFFRDARLVSLEGAGHLPYEESPEEFNRALVDFLRAEDRA